MPLSHPEGCGVELPLNLLLKDSCELFGNSCNPVVLTQYRLCNTGVLSKLPHDFTRWSFNSCTLYLHMKDLHFVLICMHVPYILYMDLKFQSNVSISMHISSSISECIWMFKTKFMEMGSPNLKPFDKLDACMDSLITWLLLWNTD